MPRISPAAPTALVLLLAGPAGRAQVRPIEAPLPALGLPAGSLEPALPSAALDALPRLELGAQDLPAPRPPDAVLGAAPEASPESPWRSFDALLSSKLGLAFMASDEAALQRRTRLAFASDPGAELDPILLKAFSQVHAVPLEAAEEAFRASLELQHIDVPAEHWAEMTGELRELHHPKAHHIFAFERGQPAVLAVVNGGVFEKTGVGYKPMDRWLEWLDMGRDNVFMMMPDRVAVNVLDTDKWWLVTSGEQDLRVEGARMVRGLKSGLWRIDLPLPPGWRERILADAARPVEVRRDPVEELRSDGERLFGSRGRAIFGGTRDP